VVQDKVNLDDEVHPLDCVVQDELKPDNNVVQGEV
jgi:hypothetical protein